MSEKYLMANGMRLCYEEFGDQNKPAIVLIMGLGTQMIAWHTDFCQSLADFGYRVIRFDNRDIGLSQFVETEKKTDLVKLFFQSKLGMPIQSPYTLRDMADDAIGVLDFLDIESAHWVGASMGGMIAQVLASTYPERTLSLTSIMSTSGRKRLPQPGLKVLKQMMKRVDRGNEEAYLRHTLKTWSIIGSPDYPPKQEELEQRILNSLRRSFSPNGYTNQVAAIMESGDRRGLLRRINRPTLVIHGKADALVPVRGGIDTAKNIKGAKLEIIDGMGHDLPRQLWPKFISSIHQLITESSEFEYETKRATG